MKDEKNATRWQGKKQNQEERLSSYLDLYKAVTRQKLAFREHFKTLFFPFPLAS
jgi:hypothetical protein